MSDHIFLDDRDRQIEWVHDDRMAVLRQVPAVGDARADTANSTQAPKGLPSSACLWLLDRLVSGRMVSHEQYSLF